MYYPLSENKGADQTCSYSTADLRLCFRIGKTPVFSRRGSYSVFTYLDSSSVHNVSLLMVYHPKLRKEEDSRLASGILNLIGPLPIFYHFSFRKTSKKDLQSYFIQLSKKSVIIITVRFI